jgi:hypothetical protein
MAGPGSDLEVVEPRLREWAHRARARAARKREVFLQCIKLKGDSHATFGILLEKLEAVGILRTDPRLAPVLQAAGRLAGCPSKAASLCLDPQQFARVIDAGGQVVLRAFEGKLVVP